MDFRALGPLEVRRPDGTRVELGSAKVRTLLAVLLADAGRPVPVDVIVDQLWGDTPPPSATGTVQTYVSQLRRALAAPGTESLVVTRAPGYALVVEPDAVDVLHLPRLVAAAHDSVESGAVADAEAPLVSAIELWRGEPFPELGDRHVGAAAERARLTELWLQARELLATVRLRLGRPDAAVVDLERLVVEHPLRERVWARLVEALYAAHRQADALEACRTAARLLRDELGIDPGPELRALEEAVLRQDPDLLHAPAPPAARPAEPMQVTEASLVGRRAERARIRAAMAEVTRGHGSVLLLEGEAGIGKTRLAEAAATSAAAQGWRVAWSRCADDAGAPSLWPWTNVVSALGTEPLAAPAEDDPDRSRFTVFEEIRGRLRATAATTPVLVVLDDLQAADTTSVQLLQLLAHHLADMRLLVVVTVRTVGEALPLAVTECLAAIASEPHAQRIQLAGLGEGDVRDLVTATLRATEDEAPPDPDGLAREVYSRTDGNPFIVVELVRLLRAEDGLAEGAARPVALPPSVRDVLSHRLTRLPEETAALLRLAALVGRDVELGLLQSAAETDAERVIELLEPAVVSGVLTEEDGWRWRFSHALVQETLLDGMPRVTEARLHARVARALEQRGDGVEVERRAHHLFHAVPVLGAAPARRYAVLAAAAARERVGHAEAAAHTRRALSLLPPGEDDVERHRLLVTLGDDLLRTGHLLEAQDVVAEALDLARRLDDPVLLAEAASVWGGVTLWNWRGYGVVDEDLVHLLRTLADRAQHHDPALQARLLGTLGVELAYSDRRADGVAYAARAVEIARDLGDPVVLGRALNNYGLVTWGSDDRVERRLEAADESMSLAGRGLPARTEFFARLHRGPLRLHLGDVEGFRQDLAGATRLAEGLTGPEVRPHILYQEAGLAMLEGDWDVAEQRAEEAYELYRRTSLWGAQCCLALHRFTFRRREGRVGEVLDLLVDGGDMGVPLLQSVAVLAAVEAGDPEEARRLRRRWAPALPQDWTTDAHVVVRAWLELRTGADVDASYLELLPLSGRQVVVGTATAVWGPYDAVLADLAAARGDEAAARMHRERALAHGRRLGSPWQSGLSVGR
ncbi:BTAD domain-containing putative transcriptional regulator [Cellulomonas carbonis]|uniref:OmpR/PhoB-type domain-containing protein n=1 Tax=Cellulomonas carbonis T26 TaxID=947969 RepID=A0A0A0BQ21_9CELL|nr:BTAD domain-containing putative transcriptional regulator [Cellulomonas carbonis]KGM10061.1 hypothetical protein N868_16870 [Cellulomonas carbonis T26]GGC18355.1 ATPase AAA [Cellulomonas carbonis]